MGCNDLLQHFRRHVDAHSASVDDVLRRKHTKHMGEENPYPVFSNAPKPAATDGGRGGRGGSTFGKVLLGILVGFPLLMFVGFKLIDCNKKDELDGDRSIGTRCDSRAEEVREQWLRTATSEFDDASPYASGFRGEGACMTSLVSKALSCDEQTVLATENGSPFLRRALERGFTTYVCIRANDGTRVEYPLRRVFGQ